MIASIKEMRKMISVALKDETQAIKFYNKLLSRTKDQNIINTITEIRNDELDHHRKLEIIKDKL